MGGRSQEERPIAMNIRKKPLSVISQKFLTYPMPG